MRDSALRNTGFHIGLPARHYLKATTNSVPNRATNVKALRAKIDQTQFNPLVYLGGNHHKHNRSQPPPGGGLVTNRWHTHIHPTRVSSTRMAW